ncbi:uncharacterized protein Z519_07455 [Cladophialophora bantiana CBS 173.52]|uniref:PLD phosphodiesterase domain-containing protein n=1 Tax=Cladophialophora bantiana (strain ATCC 10958 / CBS 173.52 / CDC B-1940 / NIH 8579) TaxID=1442370 RepID=A0A0D2I3M9_CLAB1|nr:uncharacterized protein Z519_07455 [Cladophialophora bantiana CBS 173.52]KIW91489.1 hypothetical protein Z519_07455 [Cladophialophora bantiana CBS 173.52]
MASRSSKRVKLDSGQRGALSASQQSSLDGNVTDPASIRAKRAAFLSSISRSISPPETQRSEATTPQLRNETKEDPKQHATPRSPQPQKHSSEAHHHGESSKSSNAQSAIVGSKPVSATKLIPSPFRLTTIYDLPSSKNVDTISLHDILGNPLIKEAWIFNFCFDVDWLMTHFDSDIRSNVKVKVIHGSWKNDSPNKIAIDDACRRWTNVESATAYLPDQFGTHHSKMFILFTHDDLAQVVIHTANMLEKDWTNMTQAAWLSPMLPLLEGNHVEKPGNIGTGTRFKHDILAYLAAYGSKTKALREQLTQFDFRSVRGALIASVPSRIKEPSITQHSKAIWDLKLWGYPSLLRALQSIILQQRQTQPSDKSSRQSPHVVCQISSIATLPQSWMNQFFSILYSTLQSTSSSSVQKWDPSHISIIYPTPHNVAASLDGYASGGSIHTKAQSAAHLKQIAGLRDSLYQWARGSKEETRAGRDEAAPHIKTYVCFESKPSTIKPVPNVKWALLTSANLSQQAWGALRPKDKEIAVQSYEIGVLVWPELFAEGFDPEGATETDKQDSGRREDAENNNASTSTAYGSSREKIKMIPVFENDTPAPLSRSPSPSPSPPPDSLDHQFCGPETLIGLRIPYDLPLTPYGKDDMPWSPQGVYEQPDRWGRRWPRDFS